MGNCCSHQVSSRRRPADEIEFKREEANVTNGDYGARVRVGGFSRFVSMYSQQGRKGINQDAMTVWEDFTGEKDVIFCGVFDGHGPLGHKVARFIRDNLPPKLSEAIKMSQENVSKYYDVNSSEASIDDDVHVQNNQNMSLASWEGSFLKSFNATDVDLDRDINIDSFCSGTTAVTVIKQGNQLIVANLGDSRAVLCTRGDRGQLTPIQLTVDLKPDIPSEASRIRNCEGRVFAAEEDPNVYRIWMPDEECPGLAMSRAFGDFCLKDYGLISAPDVFYRKLSKQDEFVVLATDGVWDVLTNSEVIHIVDSAPSRAMAAKLLVKRAVRAWRQKYPCVKVDDCTALCLFLTDPSVLIHSPSNVAGNSRNQRKDPLLYGSKSAINEDAGCADSKSTVETNEEWEALGGLTRSNSITKLPRHPRNMSRQK